MRTTTIVKELPDFVKDPKNFRKIHHALLDTLICPKSHSNVIDMAKCLTCTRNMKERRALMEKFGFKTAAHYLIWRQVVERMVNPDRYLKKKEGSKIKKYGEPALPDKKIATEDDVKTWQTMMK